MDRIEFLQHTVELLDLTPFLEDYQPWDAFNMLFPNVNNRFARNRVHRHDYIPGWFIFSIFAQEYLKWLRKILIFKIARPLFAKFWRMKVRWFSIIYSFRQLKKVLKHYFNKITGWLGISNDEKKEITTVSVEPEYKNLGHLPIDIWDDIVEFGGLNANRLTGLNSTFYNLFAPKMYGGGKFERLQLLLTVSSTEKMRANDTCFLKYGPDYPNEPHSSYSIYERSRDGENFNYELLNITAEPLMKIGMKTNECKELIVTNYRQIEGLFSHVLKNPKSELKKNIKSIFVDISILHGYEDFMLQKGSRIDKWIKSLGTMKKGTNLNVTQIQRTLPLVYSADHNDEFDGPRWNSERNIMRRNGWLCGTFRSIYNRENFKFPDRVYHYELAHINHMFKHYFRNQRKDLFGVRAAAGLKKFGPYERMYETQSVLSTDKLVQYGMISMDTSIASINTIIKEREFVSDERVENVLYSIINSVSPKLNDGYQDLPLSILICGIKDTKLHESKASHHKWGCDQLLQYRPMMTLINREV